MRIIAKTQNISVSEFRDYLDQKTENHLTATTNKLNFSTSCSISPPMCTMENTDESIKKRVRFIFENVFLFYYYYSLAALHLSRMLYMYDKCVFEKLARSKIHDMG